MFNQKKISLLLLCFILLSQNLFSQIVLQGTVTDNGAEYLGSGAEVVVNALVTLTDQTDKNRFFNTYTDAQGKYSILITPTSVTDNPPKTPVDFQLMQNYPNPFNPSTTINFILTRPSNIKLEIYNILGQKIKTLIDGFQPIGSGHVIWDATDDLGHGIAAGLYIYSLQIDGKSINKKMLLIDGHQGDITRPQVMQAGTEIVNQTFVNKKMSVKYLLQVSGDNIATYEQHDLDVDTNMNLDVTVIRTATDTDGNVYRTVKIGDQWWMAENLKVTHYQNEDAIPNVTSNSEWVGLSTGAYCFDNKASHADTFGFLYNWYAVYDNRNLSPTGWHVPTDEEWQTLVNYLGGYGVAGGKMKEAGTTAHWYSPNTGATNESGLSALPGGYRNNSNGHFVNMGYYAYFWSSSEHDSSTAWSRYLSYYDSEVHRSNYCKGYGFSVRCVRD